MIDDNSAFKLDYTLPNRDITDASWPKSSSEAICHGWELMISPLLEEYNLRSAQAGIIIRVRWQVISGMADAEQSVGRLRNLFERLLKNTSEPDVEIGRTISDEEQGLALFAEIVAPVK